MAYVKSKRIAAFIVAAVLTMSMIWVIPASVQASSAGVTAAAAVQWPVAVSEENFPDAVFRQYVKDNIDTDGNDQLSQSEADAVTKIKLVNNRNVTSLAGIEFFPELDTLYCDGDSLNELNTSGNPKLKSLICSDNNIPSLDLSENKMLENLECFKNGIESLDLSGNPELTNFLCGGDKMRGVDISSNQKLESFSYLAGLVKEIDFSHNPNLRQIWVSGTPLEHLDLSHNPKLESVLVYITNIQTLDLTDNPLLTADNVNLHSDRLISLHTVMPDAYQMYIPDQRAVTVQVPAGNSDYDLRQLDPKIEPGAIQSDGDVVIENAIVHDVHPGMEISYHYTENGIDLLARIRFVEKEQGSDPVLPDDPADPDDPANPDDPVIPDDPADPDDPAIPDDPTNPDDPADPDKPAVPNDQEPSGGTTGSVTNNGQSVSADRIVETAVAEKTKQDGNPEEKTIVKTGDEREAAAVIAAIMILSATGLMAFTGRKKEEK